MKPEPQPTDELARLGARLENMPVAMMTIAADEGALINCPMPLSDDAEATTLR
ncbi:MAG: hypothetical protein ABI330_14520 [Caldimonas sp.]|nr:hypothetical protein [Pseudomonadota bacterium]